MSKLLPTPEAENAPITLRRRRAHSADMDITPMIDIVFLLLIFFLVCSTLGKDASVQLPKAEYGVAVNPRTSTVLTVAGFKQDSTVFLGDGTAGRELSADKELQESEIIQAIELGLREGKTDVVIRADRRLHHGEVVRVEAIAASVPGISLFVVTSDK